MKIRDRLTRGVGSSGPLPNRGKAAGAGTAAKGAAPSDRVMISGRGVDIQRARSLALAAPEIRQEMVDEIVGLLERGEYQVTGADVAPKMIQEHLAYAVE
ncbi:MAG TPA: flagellar biosynthesis anti-sigma factor FlgM [Deferrisomatales bacterium]|nr:flagellar biosynthesis anti-sigma factor FlgM [Deferrisomatales bacterium]